MDRDELLRMLDLAGAEAGTDGATEGGVLSLSPAVGPPGPPAGPTALVLDGWGLRRGAELLASSERLKALGTDGHAAADFLAAAFEPAPELAPACADALRHRFLTQLLETPQYRALHAATRLDESASAIAAVAFAEQFARLEGRGAGAPPAVEAVGVSDAGPPPPAGRREEAPDATTSEAGPSAGAAARVTAPAGEGLPAPTEAAVLRAVGRALAAAGEEVEAAAEAAAALGMGLGQPGSNDPRAIAALYRRVRADPALRRICDHAGRLRRLAQSRQRLKVAHGADEVVGVGPGGDPSRLLPAELARLMLPETELDALRRLAEGQALSLDLRGSERVGRGPVIVVVDESGSMEGPKAETAKALALALAWLARRQRRWCALVAYSGDSGERLLPLPPGRWDEGALADWLGAFLGGGSTLDVPLREMPGYYARLKAPAGKTDLVFLTDAQLHAPPDVARDFLEWKARVRARLISLVVGGQPGDLARLSDEAHTVRALDASEEAVGRALSL